MTRPRALVRFPWGTLAGAIIMLTWLWLSALALLFAAEVDAETSGRGGKRPGASNKFSPTANRSAGTEG